MTLAERQGNNLILDGFEVTDNFGHFGFNFLLWGVNFQMRVYVNGVLSNLATALTESEDTFGNLIPLRPMNVTLPKQSATVEVVMQMQPLHPCCPHGWSPLATNVTSDIVFVTNPGQQGPIPLPTYNYDVKNLDVLNRAQTDNNENIEIKVSMLAPDGTLIRPMDPSAEIALNFGSNWTPASVTVLGNGGMLVTAHIPATGHGYDFYVSLRIGAHTAHGITYTQTIITAVHAIS